MKNKKTVLAAVALVVVLAIFAGVYLLTRPETNQGSKTITLTVIHKNGDSKVFTIHTDAEYLSAALLDEKIIEPSNDGMYYTVDGETADYSVDQGFWAFYVGEESSMLGMDLTPVNDGDTFKLVYTIYTGEYE